MVRIRAPFRAKEKKPALRSAKIHAGENPASLTSTASNIAFCLKTDTGVVTLTFDPKINGFPGLIVEHLYVKLGDPIAALVLRYRAEKQTHKRPLKNSTHETNDSWLGLICTGTKGYWLCRLTVLWSRHTIRVRRRSICFVQLNGRKWHGGRSATFKTARHTSTN